MQQPAAQLPAGQNKRQPTPKRGQLAIVQQPAAQLASVDPLLWSIPWWHHSVLLSRVKDLATRIWYMHQILAQGWSRDVLSIMIDGRAHERQGAAVTNFERTLPAPQSDLARQLLRDPYIFANFYCTTVDEQHRHAADHPTIGLILCRTQNRVIAEYALRDINKPIGVAAYEITRSLPKELASSLPSIEQIETELQAELEDAAP